MKEIWKDIIGYDYNYKISNYGRLKNRLGKLANNTRDSYGYIVNTLIINGKGSPVKRHRLVAIAFIKNPLNKPTVNHIDGNKTNNNISNLEWATLSEQQKHSCKLGLKCNKGENHPSVKLNETTVKQIYMLSISSMMTQSEIGKRYNISSKQVSNIKLKKNWKHILKDL